MSVKSVSIVFVLLISIAALAYGWNLYQDYKLEKDISFWNRILEKANIASSYQTQISIYQEYLSLYPQGKYSSTAHQEITRALALQKAETLWSIAESKKIQSLQDYSDAIQAYQKYCEWAPKGRYASKAKEKIESLKYQREEENFWLLSFSKAEMEKMYESKISLYQSYLQRYPQGKYKEKALDLIQISHKALEEEKYYHKIIQEVRDFCSKGKYEEAYKSCLQYSQKYPSSSYSSLLALEIKEIQRKKETLAFEEKAKEAKKYCERENFDKALEEIGDYLAQYKNPYFEKDAQDLILKIQEAKEESLYQKTIAFTGNLIQRIESLEQFLKVYPKGRRSEEIQKLLKEYKKEYIARKILRTPPDGLKKEESLKGASQKLLDLLELVQDSWKSKDQERALKQLKTAYSLVDKESPIVETLENLEEYLYYKELERLLEKGDLSVEDLCKEAISRFPNSQKFKNFLGKASQENIPLPLRESY